MQARTSIHETAVKNAGSFSVWLNEFVRTMEGKISISVPCGACVACCTSSKFIHLRPSDRDALNIIPQEILFPAPGLPKGYYLLGYDENGHCPMFKDGKCSIYESRPETCRQYDCRVFAATRIFTDDEGAEIAGQARMWQFCVTSHKDKAKYQAVQKAVKFLSNHREYFPEGYLPRLKSQIAVFAIRIHEEFHGFCSDSHEKNLKDLANTIVSKYQNSF